MLVIVMGFDVIAAHKAVLINMTTDEACDVGSKHIGALSMSPVQEVMKEKALLKKIISQFFPSEWPNVDEKAISVRKIADGMVNTVMVVSRPSNQLQLEPCEMIVRMTGGMLVPVEEFSEFSKLSESEEILVVNEMSRHKWGPQLYGVFAGGRLEEYIPSHTLSGWEWACPDVRRDIAKSYARFHSLQPPLKRDKFQLLVQDMTEAMQRDPGHRQLMRETILATGNKYSVEAADNMIDHPAEFPWHLSLFRRYQCTQTFTILDGNYLNILVRAIPTSMGRIVLVDYELAKYGYRGADIGAHFVNRLIEWQNKEDKHSGAPYPSLDERMAFCRDYMDEWRSLGRMDREGGGTDTPDHLLLESEVGALFYCCYMSAVLYRYMHVFLKDAAFVSSMKSLNDTYVSLKHAFLRAHPESAS